MFGNGQLTPEFFTQLGIGLLGGATNPTVGLAQGFSNANNVLTEQKQLAQMQQETNKTRAWLQKAYPNQDFSGLQGEALRNVAMEAMKQQMKPNTPDYQFLQGGDKIFLGNKADGSLKEVGNYTKPADLPAIAEEFKYAQSQGFKGSFQDYQTYKAGLNKSGFMVEQTPDGMRVVQGDLSSAPNKMTEGQSKDVNWLYRGLGSNEALKSLDKNLTSLGEDTAAKLGTPGNYLKSEEYQKAEQAAKEFIAVVLRKDTGAAVTKEEMQLYAPMFLPVPGDKPAAIAQKAAARQRFLEGLTLGIPGNIRKTVPGAETLFADPNATQTTTPETTDRKTITLQDGTQGTIRRTK